MRKFQVATLDNGIQVVTVKDTHALQKGFAAAVEAGSFDDPVELPGLAHFCEHMLFLGTKKHPKASGFDEFMANNGGSNNAYTDTEVTVYYGQVTLSARRSSASPASSRTPCSTRSTWRRRSTPSTAST